jgi:hypothetical protein
MSLDIDLNSSDDNNPEPRFQIGPVEIAPGDPAR